MTHLAEIHTEIAETDHNYFTICSPTSIEWVIIGPEQPLIDGLSNKLRDNHVKVFGPNKEAAQIEGSKSFAKRVMEKYDIPTADYKEIDNKTEALNYVNDCELPIVVKKDGLAAGKGVIIANTRDEAIEAVEVLYPQEDKLSLNNFLKEKNSHLHSLMVIIQFLLTVLLKIINVPMIMTKVLILGMGAYCPVPHISK